MYTVKHSALEAHLEELVDDSFSLEHVKGLLLGQENYRSHLLGGRSCNILHWSDDLVSTSSTFSESSLKRNHLNLPATTLNEFAESGSQGNRSIRGGHRRGLFLGIGITVAPF